MAAQAEPLPRRSSQPLRGVPAGVCRHRRRAVALTNLVPSAPLSATSPTCCLRARPGLSSSTSWAPRRRGDPLSRGALRPARSGRTLPPRRTDRGTTHLGAVKTFVHEQAGMVNASVPLQRRKPAAGYVLDIGRPGVATLNIARRLGLPHHPASRREASVERSSAPRRYSGAMEEDQRQLSVREDELKRRSPIWQDRTELRQELQALKKSGAGCFTTRLSAGHWHPWENTRRQMENMLGNCMPRTGRARKAWLWKSAASSATRRASWTQRSKKRRPAKNPCASTM